MLCCLCLFALARLLLRCTPCYRQSHRTKTPDSKKKNREKEITSDAEIEREKRGGGVKEFGLA